MENIENIKDIINLKEFNFKKKFGQNFITDKNLLKAIVLDSEINSDDEVLEIGVGAGTLTKEIACVGKKVVGYEIDNELDKILKKSLENFNNVEIIFNDILKVLDSEINNHFSKKFKIVANLPYYITTPIIFKFLENEKVDSLTIMVQKEVAERIVAKESTKDYGILTVMINSIADVKIKRIVNKNMFIPSPDVDSAIINIKIKKDKFNILSRNYFRKIVNCGFNKRRKMFLGNLKNDFGFDKELLNKIFDKLNLSKEIRGEALNLSEFVNLSNELLKVKNLF